MTMLSFRVADQDAEEARRWADVLGVDRSELLRGAASSAPFGLIASFAFVRSKGKRTEEVCATLLC